MIGPQYTKVGRPLGDKPSSLELYPVSYLDDWANNIEKRLPELVKWKEEGDIPVMPRIKVVPLFIAWIINEPLPANFKMSTIKKFDGASYAHEHIMVYQVAMMLMGANDAVMCMSFFFMLGSIAQRWPTRTFGHEGAMDMPLTCLEKKCLTKREEMMTQEKGQS